MAPAPVNRDCPFPKKRTLLGVLIAGIGFLGLSSVRADVIDTRVHLQEALDAASMEIHGEGVAPQTVAELDTAASEFAGLLEVGEAESLWSSLPPGEASTRGEATRVGAVKAIIQHVAALEMIGSLERGDLEKAKEWRAIIALPKYANAIDGTLALQGLGGSGLHRDKVSGLLAREYLLWQTSRVRELGDDLRRLILRGRATPELVLIRASEIRDLACFPERLVDLAGGGGCASSPETNRAYEELIRLYAKENVTKEELADAAVDWRLSLESSLPVLLSPNDISKRERIVLKLLRLVPKEYASGVRDGEITVALEYQEARSFTAQAWLLINELQPVWAKKNPVGHQERVSRLIASMEALENDIEQKKDPGQVALGVKAVTTILTENFGLKLTKAPGTGKDVVDESALEIRTLLGESLAEASAGHWKKAEELRLDAYINFDLEIEPRIIPRDPQIGLRSERSFLEGDPGAPGIKALLDAHAPPDALAASYARTLTSLDQCVSLVKVSLSPAAAAISAGIIVLREGLEAVVILAALLAGMRGVENRTMRRQVGIGAWCALVISAVLFIASQSILKGLSRYGEKLEAGISILAVLILLMVTNWVFHKYYWTGWNTRLRGMSKAAQQSSLEGVAMIGVGFMTIFREGFETTLFMQSLILEAGMRPVLAGFFAGGSIIAAMGLLIFQVGTKLPYRRMLVCTGVLVVFILYSFLGSTVRLFQTVGWLSIHPVPSLKLPIWMGQWLGIYPSWEGLIIPMMAFVYVGGAWLWVKIRSSTELPPSIVQGDPGAASILVANSQE